MPAGKVNSGDFRNGTPMILPHQFGTPIGIPEPFGNVQPQSNPSMDSNPVTWVPSPAHFGNTVEFSLQSVPPIVVIAPGNAGTVDINLAQLLDSPTATLSYSGAPVGVTIAFAPNPDTGVSVATVTVGALVPVGKYTITIKGTGANETNFTNIHLVVSGAGGPPPASVALVAHVAATGEGNNPVTGAIDTTGADFLVAIVSTDQSLDVPAVSDNMSNVWQPLTIYGSNSSAPTLQMWYVFNPTVGAGHTFTGHSEFETSIEVAAFSGLDTTSAVFEAGSDLGHVGSGAQQPGAVTPADTGDLIISGYANHDFTGTSGPGLVDSGFTVTDSEQNARVASTLAYLIAPDTSAVNPSWVATNQGQVFSAGVNIAVFKHA